MIYRALISEYQKYAFMGKAPCAATIRRQIVDQEIPGEQRGGTYYVFVYENWQLADGYTPNISNPLAQEALKDWQQSA